MGPIGLMAATSTLSSRSALPSHPSCVTTLDDPPAADGSNWVVDEDERDERAERDGRGDDVVGTWAENAQVRTTVDAG